MKGNLQFILVDDDAINNTICKMTIKKTIGEMDIVDFTNPKKGFEYIANDFSNNSERKNAVLFLDINMPEVNGWDFLELFGKLDNDVRQRIKIFLLSSSINIDDINKASADKNVTAFISKPLPKTELVKIYEAL